MSSPKLRSAPLMLVIYTQPLNVACSVVYCRVAQSENRVQQS